MTEVTISRKNQIVIPKEARIGMKVGAGRRLLVETINGVTVLVPRPKNFSTALNGISRGIYQKSHLKKERQSW